MLQVFINGLIAASWFALIGIGFGLIFQVTKFFHFTHGIVFTSGAYFAFLFTKCSLPLYVSIFLAIIIAALLGASFELLVYRHIRHRSSLLVLLLASLGIYILIQNLISLGFGDSTVIIRTGIAKSVDVFTAKITSMQIITICISVALVITLELFQRRSKTAMFVRAVANDPELANVSGININRIILLVFILGSTLAGIAGILVALDVDMNPDMGMSALMMGMIATIIGSTGRTLGIVMGALFLGMAQHFGAWFIGSQWQNAIAFVILVIFLLFKPEGFLGKKIRSATV